MNFALISRYHFAHGDDFQVEYLGTRDDERVMRDHFAVTGADYKVYFDMMRLLPRNIAEAKRPRNWGFGDINDPVTGNRVWDFGTFARTLEFKGDMTAVRGDDKRTYVECRARDGTLKHRFLLAELLPQWKTAASMPVPPLEPAAEVVPAEAAPVAVKVPEVMTTEPPSAPAIVAAPTTLRRPAHRTSAKLPEKPIVLADPSKEMLYFVESVLWRMARAPEHLRTI